MQILVVSHACVIPINRDLFAALTAFGADVTIITPAAWLSDITGTVTRTAPGGAEHWRVIRAPIAFNGRATLYTYTRLPLTWLRRFQPDLIFVDAEPWSLVAAQSITLARLIGCPLVFYTKQNIARAYPPPFNIIRRVIYQQAEAAFSISDETTQVLRMTGFTKPVMHLPHVVNPELHCATPRRQSNNSPDDGQAIPIIGYVGRLVPQKGVKTLLQALVLLRDIQPHQAWQALIVGDGVDREDLERFAARVGIGEQVHFRPSVSHSAVAQVYAGMDILVVPSRTTPRWKEQFGRVVIEALACGVPVVGSDSGEIPHIISRSGGGLVFAEGDAAALARHLSRLLNDAAERTRLATLGKTYVLEHFTPDAVARDLYASLAQYARQK